MHSNSYSHQSLVYEGGLVIPSSPWEVGSLIKIRLLDVFLRAFVISSFLHDLTHIF
jgi:hypothetical protein